jgi:hypothetical protein
MMVCKKRTLYRTVQEKGGTVLDSIIFTFICIILIFIIIGILVSSKARKNQKSRKDNATFISPYHVGDSDHKHSQDDKNTNDSFDGFGGDSSGDGGGGGD